jgi:ribosomal protein S18 acetylase RimI-like enzyme
MTIEVHLATADRFADVASLLAPGRPDIPACWCLSYRLASGPNNALKGEARPAFLRKLCEQDPPPGMLAYSDSIPVGWCAFGPRSDMGRLQRSRTIPLLDNIPVWSIVCLVVRSGYRRRGVTRALIDAVVKFAQSRHAVALEAYPVDTGGKRLNPSAVFPGTVSLFERSGFRRIGETDARSGGRPRCIVRRYLAGQAGQEKF